MGFYKKIRRVITKSVIKSTIEDKKVISEVLNHHIANGQLKKTESLFNKKLLHIANFTTGNAGDTILTVILRDLFSKKFEFLEWNHLHVHDKVTGKTIRKINQNDAIVIGGGGLFLKDTNPNTISGWGWPIRDVQYKEIDKPLIVFAVGYNRFRGQEDFGGKFQKNINKLFEISEFVGLRNHGSINNIKRFVDKSLHDKIFYQPCMTTVISKIYPDVEYLPGPKEITVGLNCAFDRPKNRFGENYKQIIESVCNLTEKIGREFKLTYLSHTPSDEKFLEYLDKKGISYNLTKLYHKSSETIIKEYKKLSLVIGMRGHAQMIPFGCNTPILSIYTHEKVKWFLEDINLEKYGVDVHDLNLEEKAYNIFSEIIKNLSSVEDEIREKQNYLWEITQENLGIIGNKIGLNKSQLNE